MTKAATPTLFDMKTCRHCGSQGPTWEFRVFTLRNGTRSWGNVCQACRAKQQETGHRRYLDRIKGTQKWRDQFRRNNQRSGLKRKQQVFSHYGLKCVWCGESDLMVLTIDHVNNDGATHRRKTGRSGGGLYFWLIKNGFPSGFQTLCMNCNMAKQINGGVLPPQRIGLHQAQQPVVHAAMEK